MEVVSHHPNGRIFQICLSSLPKSYERPVDVRRRGARRPALADFTGLIVRLKTAKGRHKVFDLAGRRCFVGFEVALDA